MYTMLKLSLLSFLSEVTVVSLAIYLPYRAFQLGANNVTAGIIGGASSIVYMFMPFAMGKLADRFGAKNIFLLGTILLFLTSFSYFLLSNLNLIIMMRIIEGIGWAMIWPPLEAMVSSESSTVYGNLAKFNISWGLGAALAPTLGAVIEHESSIKYTLLFASICMFIASLLASTLNKTIPNIKNQANNNKNNRHSVLYSLYFTGMYGITINVITTFFPKYASLNSLTVVEWGSIISSLMLARLIAFILAEGIRQRISIKNMFALFSFVSIVFPFAAIIVSSNFLILIISSALTGFSLGLVYSAALNKMMIDSFGGKGVAAGLFESSIGIGSFLGPILAGVVAMSNLWAFLLVPLATMLGGGLLGVTKRRALSINSS